MKVEVRSIDSVAPYDRNPRRNDGAVDAVAKSIAEYGFRQPIVVDEDGVIIVGHTRWKAARKLGLSEVPVHVAVGLSAEKAKAYRLADNRLNEIAEWDDELLPLELAELKDLGIDLADLGWSPAELTKLFAPAGTPDIADPDETPEPPAMAVTRPGDVWILDQHRLLCGDSTSPSDVLRVLDGRQAALCATDPPYLVDYTGERHTCGHRTARRQGVRRQSARCG